MTKNKIKRLPTTMKEFDLNDNTEADQYYALLEYISKRGVEVPVLAKGTKRVIDFGISSAKKIDKELNIILTSAPKNDEQIALGLA